jgi:hypothetical protein
MAINFNEQLSPTSTNMDKVAHRKVVRLRAADFVTGGIASVKCVLPGDSSIISMGFWKRTQFSGGGVTAASLSIGITGTPANFVSAYDVFTPAAGVSVDMTPITNIMQEPTIPTAPDISLLFTGTATTGNPTAGEIIVSIVYVR